MDMLDAGALKLNDSASDAYNLAVLGIEQAMGPVLSRIEGMHGDNMVQVHRGTGNAYTVIVYDYAIYNRTTIKPMFERIGMHSEAAKWAAAVLNQHWGVGSPSNWLNVASECATLSQKETTEGHEPEWDEADEKTKAAYKKWEKEFQAEFPWLFVCKHGEYAGGNRPAVVAFNDDLKKRAGRALVAIKKRDRKLAEIFDGLINGIGRQADIGNGEPYLVTQWTNDDPISHGWDYVDHQISEGNYDQSGLDPMLSFEGTFTEIKQLFAKADAWLAPVAALESWTYKKS